MPLLFLLLVLALAFLAMTVVRATGGNRVLVLARRSTTPFAHLFVLTAIAFLAVTTAQATTYNPRNITQTIALYDVATDSFTAPAMTDGVSFVATPITVQVGGTATAITAVLERSTTDPTVAASWATVDTYSGAAASVGFKSYQEGGIGWWRVRVTAVAGGTVTIAMTGRRG